MRIFTCILTLAVSKGNVAKSAIQAAVPAESNFIHKGNSSDACCFIVLSFFSLSFSPTIFFFSFFLLLRFELVDWSVRSKLMHASDACMGVGIVQSFEFSRLLEIPAWLVSILRACSFFFFFYLSEILC